METDDPDDVLAAVAALGDPLRRRLYRFVAARDHAVSRDEVAEGADVSRSAAAFHLDRLVDEGLLEVEFRRLTGRQGPGAGRPAKLYRRAGREFSVSLPGRRYERAAALLAAAVAEANAAGVPVEDTLVRVAGQEGARIAERVAPPGGRSSSQAGWARSIIEALAEEGYEPRPDDGEIGLANCPFSSLAADHPELVCGMNLALLEGFTAALPAGVATARLLPTEGACCVRLSVTSA